MVQPVFPAAPRGPSSAASTVPLRIDAEPLGSLPHELLRDLRLRLVNHEFRGDMTDRGVGAGSHMRNVIDDALAGFSVHGHWAATAWPVGTSRFRGPVAWAHLEPELTRDDAIQVGFYCAPDWRRKGLGRLLVDECVRLAHRLGYRRLVAHPWNKSSHAFFLGAGFTCVNQYGGALSGLSEREVPQVLPPRPLFRVQCPEV